MKFFYQVLAFLIFASTAYAQFDERIHCPGGVSHRTDIIACYPFDDLTSCAGANSVSNTCWAANNTQWNGTAVSSESTYPSGLSTVKSDDPRGMGVKANTANNGMIGAGSFNGAVGQVGSTGGGFYPRSFAANTTEGRYRAYVRKKKGNLEYSSDGGPHGFNITVSAAGATACGKGIGFERNNLGGWDAYGFRFGDPACPTISNPLHTNNGTESGADKFLEEAVDAGEYPTGRLGRFTEPMNTEQTYLFEVAFKMDTFCTDSSRDFGCNGWLKVYIDGVSVFEKENLNWGNVESQALNGSNAYFTSLNLFRDYDHSQEGISQPRIVWDEVVISNDADIPIGETVQTIAGGKGTGYPAEWASAQFSPNVIQGGLANTSSAPCKSGSDWSCPSGYMYFFKFPTGTGYINGNGTAKSTIRNHVSVVEAPEANVLYDISAQVTEGRNVGGSWTGNEIAGAVEIDLQPSDLIYHLGGRADPPPELFAVDGRYNRDMFARGWIRFPEDGKDFSGYPCFGGFSRYSSSAHEGGSNSFGEHVCLAVNPSTKNFEVRFRDASHNGGNEVTVGTTTSNVENNEWYSYELKLNADAGGGSLKLRGVEVWSGTFPVPWIGGTSQRAIFWGYKESTKEGVGVNMKVQYANVIESSVSGEDCSEWPVGGCPDTGIGTAQFFNGGPEFTQEVNTTCPNNGDGTTSSCGTAGGTGAFNTLSSVSTQNLDLDQIDKNLIVNITGSVPDLNQVVFDGWNTTGQAIVLNFDSTYWLSPVITTGQALLIEDDNITLNGFQCELTSSSNSSGACVRIGDGENIIFNNPRIRNTGDCNTDNLACTGIDFTPSGKNNKWLINPEITGLWNAGIRIHDKGAGSGNWGIYYPTIYGTDDVHIYIDDGDVACDGQILVKNALLQGDTDADNYIVAAGNCPVVPDQILTSDTSSPTPALRNKTVLFQSVGGFNFQILSSDTSGALDSGVDLSADPFFPVTKDRNDVDRTDPTTIGAYETDVIEVSTSWFGYFRRYIWGFF